MDNNILNIAESYYKAMGRKDESTMATYLHNDVKFFGPLAQLQGRDNVLAGVKGFFAMYSDIDIQEKFVTDNKVMLVYNLVGSTPVSSIIRVAVLITFTDNLISEIEVFFDTKGFGI